MGKYDDIYADVMSGKRDSNIKFTDLQGLLEHLGFSKRVRGDHFIYWMEEYPDIINVQLLGNKAKPYQVKQIRRYFNRHKI